MLPELGSAEPVEFAAAPSAPESERGWLAALLPGLSALGMLGFAFLSPNVLLIGLIGGVGLLSTLVAVAAARHQRRRRDRLWSARRERYGAHLASRVRLLAEAATRQRAYAMAAYPSPETAAIAAETGRLWDRQPEHDDYLWVRLGIGRVPARRAPRLQGDGGDPDGDPGLRAAAAAVGRHSAVDIIPVTLDLGHDRAIVFTAGQLGRLRAVAVSLARSHGPDLLRLHALAPVAEQQRLRTLPHAGCVTSDATELIRVVRAQLRQVPTQPETGQHVVLVAAGGRSTSCVLQALDGQLRQRLPLAVLALLEPGSSIPPEASLVVSADTDGGIVISRPGQRPQLQAVAQPDSVTYAQALDFAERARRRAPTTATSPPGGTPLLLAPLLATSHERQPLRIPLGCDEDDVPVLLDLREAARGGDGPHGLIIGATGTGKSELLRTVLIAAAHQSSPEELVFLLVDYKGGAAFSELARLPHTAGLVTNLNADRSGIERLCASLRAELRRRQRTLRAAEVDDIDSYWAVADGADGADSGLMPRLMVVVDEYAELIEESPDVLDVLMSIGRLGRSLGIHLLLASQRLDDGRLRGLDAHLRFRICLRTTSAAESVAVIGTPVAATLPSAPGWAFLCRDGALTRVRIAVVGHPADAVNQVQDRPAGRAAATVQVRQVVLPALPEVLGLSPTVSPADRPRPGTAVMGLLDLPELGEQHPLTFDVTGPSGHLAVAGAPRSGRSTLLATVVAALAGATTLRELSIHVIASAASVLTGIAGLPHVGTVATTPELTGRVVRAIADAVDERLSSGAQSGGRILLVVDDIGTAVNSDDTLMSKLGRIATAGLSVGVSLALSCGRWTELRGGLREAIGTCWELGLNDAADSLHPQLTRGRSRPVAGRILTGDGCWAQVALPRVDGVATTDTVAEALMELVASVARRGGPATRPIQLLPTRVPASLLPPPSRAGRVPLGLRGTYAEPVEIGLAAGEHLVVLGNSGSGRSGLLRAVVAAANGWGAQLWLIDPRRSLEAVAAGCHRRASTPVAALSLIEELAAACFDDGGRTEPAGHVLVIDDLDLAAGSAGTTPFTALVELLPFAADLGLSVVASRRVSGSSRASFEAFFGRLLEVCATSVLLSGDPAEGPVIGGLRPCARPPGRGQLVLGGEPAGELQTAWLDDGPPRPRHEPRAAAQESSRPTRGT